MRGVGEEVGVGGQKASERGTEQTLDLWRL